MAYRIYFDQSSVCEKCTQSAKGGFKFIQNKKGDKISFESTEAFTIIFLLTGSVRMSYNEITNVMFCENEMCLLPISTVCSWEVLEDSSAILISGEGDLSLCDSESIQNNAEYWFNTPSVFYTMQIRPRMLDFLKTVKNYVEDNIPCPHIYDLKIKEMSVLFKAYYPIEELVKFFIPVVKSTHEFETFVMSNYMKMKGVREFVGISGMNVGTFIRKFKERFGETPYQWMIKQKSKHILHELSREDKSIASIMREFGFSDASHFNRYCKAMFGSSPSEFRARLKKTKASELPPVI